MKKTLITLLALVGMMSASAQQTWDFTHTPDADSTALAAAKSEWTATTSGTINRFESINAIEGAITAGGQELTMTKGLTISGAAAKKIRIDVNNRLQLAGKNITVSTPALQKGQVVTIEFASTGDNAVTFDQQTNLSGTSGFTTADKNTVQKGTGTVTADGSVSFKSTGGSINIFSISVSGGSTPAVEDFNKAVITLRNNTVKQYNTANVSSIDLADNGKVTVTANGKAESFDDVASINFVKKQTTTPDTPDPGDDPTPGDDSTPTPDPDSDPEPAVIINGDLTITDAKGWLESAYVKWNLLEGAKSYAVYVKGGQYADFTKIDQQLVRNYGTYGRADVVGLKAGTYELKVIPVNSNNQEEASKSSSVSNIEVKSYDRAGFAHKNMTGIGGYNDDGTLKTGAKVLYITKNNFNTVTLEMVTDAKKGTKQTFTGLGKIFAAKQKGTDNTPIVVRIIGEIKHADTDSDQRLSDEDGLQLKGNKAETEMNVTMEGIGEDACFNGFGMTFYNGTGVEMRNLAILNFKDDGVQLKGTQHAWIHHNDFFYGNAGSASDQAKGDGSLDVKDDSRYCTFSYNHFWDSGKTSLCGMKSESGPNYLCYHHNWFDHSDSRHPRVRSMSVHVWNNYYDGVAKIGVGAVKGANIFVEANYFRNSKNPMLISEQGTDGRDGFADDHEGGMIKAFANKLTGKSLTTYIPHTQNATEFDAYEASARDEKVPDTYKCIVGNHTYNNFDTDASLMYEYAPNDAEEVPGIVKGWFGAGRQNHGDLQWTFSDADDTLDAVNSALKKKVTEYKTTLVGIFGEGNTSGGGSSDPTPGGGDDPTPGGGDDPTPGSGDDPTPGSGETPITGATLCSFDGSPSHSMFTIGGDYGDGKITYNGVNYKKGVKLNSSGSITFTPTQNYKMTIVMGTAKNGRDVKLNGEKTTVSGTENTTGAYYQLEPINIVAGNEYIITKGSAEGLVMLIILEP